MALSTYAEIIQKVPTAFKSAHDSGDLLFFPSTVVKHEELGVPFEIRLCPALQHKPALPTPHFDSVDINAGTAANKKFDPFAPPYNPQLYVGDLKDDQTGDLFAILLNKYSVISHHFLLVTKEFSSQASPPLPSELVQTYQLLAAARRAGQNFFAFYNCGDNSGASQPHKHIQFIPIETPGGPPIEVLARKARLEAQDRPFSLTSFPYASHSYRLPSHFLDTNSPDEIEQILASAFLRLLDLAISTIRHDPDYPTGRPSYNIIMTLEHIHIIPRKNETHTLSNGDKLSVNSLGFAGMLLVKNEAELETVKEESIGKILRGVGLESVHDLQIEGTSAEPPISAIL